MVWKLRMKRQKKEYKKNRLQSLFKRFKNNFIFLKNMTSKESHPEFAYELKIPRDRIAVLIGKNGETKKHLESITKTKMDIDSKEGEVYVTGKDPVTMYVTKEIITAIGRGFNPEIAQLLLKQDYAFELIDVSDFAKSNSELKRLKGRVIGQEGKSRRAIEELAEVHISVYGKTISIIGEVSTVAVARKAVESLLEGAEHSSVYKSLERHRREMKKKFIEGVM
jgi:ribosomal RNA assembly protein